METKAAIATAVDPDAEVLELVDRDDTQGALRLLMRRHGVAVYRYCREALRDQTLADDVHQQIFIEAHRDLKKFARHRVLDAAKSRGRAQKHVEHDETADVADPGPTAAERIDDARLIEALAHCVGALPHEIRESVLLRYQQGFSYEEMADICEQKAGTLQARVTRALTKLRACIEERTGGTP